MSRTTCLHHPASKGLCRLLHENPTLPNGIVTLVNGQAEEKSLPVFGVPGVLEFATGSFSSVCGQKGNTLRLENSYGNTCRHILRT